MKLAATFLVALTLAACGSDSKSSDTSSDSTSDSTTATTVETSDSSSDTTVASGGDATVVLADTDLGAVLATADGMTLYLFTPDADTSGGSACSGECATTWPPLVAPGTPGEGLDAGDFGSITRDDGTEQVTFAGQPLYTFAGDVAAGDTNGQGVGGSWFVVGADGSAIGAGSGATGETVPGYEY